MGSCKLEAITTFDLATRRCLSLRTHPAQPGYLDLRPLRRFRSRERERDLERDLVGDRELPEELDDDDDDDDDLRVSSSSFLPFFSTVLSFLVASSSSEATKSYFDRSSLSSSSSCKYQRLLHVAPFEKLSNKTHSL